MEPDGIVKRIRKKIRETERLLESQKEWRLTHEELEKVAKLSTWTQQLALLEHHAPQHLTPQHPPPLLLPRPQHPPPLPTPPPRVLPTLTPPQWTLHRWISKSPDGLAVHAS